MGRVSEYCGVQSSGSLGRFSLFPFRGCCAGVPPGTHRKSSWSNGGLTRKRDAGEDDVTRERHLSRGIPDERSARDAAVVGAAVAVLGVFIWFVRNTSMRRG